LASICGPNIDGNIRENICDELLFIGGDMDMLRRSSSRLMLDRTAAISGKQKRKAERELKKRV
jgi:hypothetical protein